MTAQHASGNVARLAIAQALAGANSTVVYATGAIVGNALAPLPISVFVVGMAACTLSAGAIARRHGRRAAFLAGTACGVLVGLLSALAVVLGSFWLFCLGTFFGGAYAAVVLSFRFAAADGVPAARRARDAAWLERVRRNYGSEPVVQYFETPLIVDNALGETIDEGGQDAPS